MRQSRQKLLNKRFLLLLASIVAALSLGLVACGDDDDDDGGDGGGVSGSLQTSAIWTGAEAEAFQAVLDGFTEQNPDVTVKFNSAGEQLPTVLSTAVEGGNPPDIAFVAQPGLAEQF